VAEAVVEEITPVEEITSTVHHLILHVLQLNLHVPIRNVLHMLHLHRPEIILMQSTATGVGRTPIWRTGVVTYDLNAITAITQDIYRKSVSDVSNVREIKRLYTTLNKVTPWNLQV
jgi:hypothetical protein